VARVGHGSSACGPRVGHGNATGSATAKTGRPRQCHGQCHGQNGQATAMPRQCHGKTGSATAKPWQCHGNVTAERAAPRAAPRAVPRQCHGRPRACHGHATVMPRACHGARPPIDRLVGRRLAACRLVHVPQAHHASRPAHSIGNKPGSCATGVPRACHGQCLRIDRPVGRPAGWSAGRGGRQIPETPD